MRTWTAVVVVLGLWLGGCAGPVGPARFTSMLSAKVQTRAAFDFSCPAANIRVTVIDERDYGAEGCGHRGTYVAQPAICNSTRLTEQGVDMYCSLVLNNASETTTAPPSAQPSP